MSEHHRLTGHAQNAIASAQKVGAIADQLDDAKRHSVLVGVDKRMQVVPVRVKIQLLTRNFSPRGIESAQDGYVSKRLFGGHGTWQSAQRLCPSAASAAG